MNKFLLILKSELYQLRYKYFLIIAIIAVIYNIPLLLHNSFGNNTLVINSLTYILMSITMIVAPFYLYGFLHQDKRSFFYAMRPASMIKKYSSLLLQCFIIVPAIVFITSRLFENSFTAFNWVKYIADDTSFWESSSITRLISLEFLAVLVNTSISVFAVNFFKYKKIMKSITFLYLLPWFILYLLAWTFYIIFPDIWKYIATIMEGIMSSPSAPNYVNIIAVMVVIAINYISWRVFKTKQL